MKPFIFVLSLLVFIACKNDDNSNNNNSSAFANLTTDIVKDTWKISFYADDGVDETTDYSAYTFTFNADGTVNAVTDLFSENGTWAYEDSSNDSTDDDGIDNDEEFILLFPASNILDEISDDWHITSANANQVVLYDISGGNGTTDNLTFTKQ